MRIYLIEWTDRHGDEYRDARPNEKDARKVFGEVCKTAVYEAEVVNLSRITLRSDLTPKALAMALLEGTGYAEKIDHLAEAWPND